MSVDAILGGMAATMATTPVAQQVGSVFQPQAQLTLYAANHDLPIAIPEAGELLRLLWSNKINFQEFEHFSRSLGIAHAEHEPILGRFQPFFRAVMAPLWEKVRTRQRPIPSFEAMADLVNRGQWTLAQMQEALTDSGFGARGLTAGLLSLLNRFPPMDQLFQMRNRETITEAMLDRAGAANGLIWGDWWGPIKDLRFWLPNPPDLVSFAVREAWDDLIAGQYGYDAEFPAAFDYWMKKAGAGGQADFPPLPPGSPPGMTWAKIFWRAHWQRESPTQAYEMFHRLRANRLHRYNEEFPGIRAYTLQDVRNLLKVQDYPSGVRDQMAAVNSTLLTRVDIQRAYELGVISLDEVYEQFRDRGYTPADADILKRFTDRQSKKRQAGRFLDRSRSYIEQAYLSGFYSRQQTAVALYEIALEDITLADEWRRKSMAERVQIAMGTNTILWALDVLDAKMWTQFTKEAVRTLRNIYINGRLNEPQIRQKLTMAGISQDRADKLILLWNFHKLGPRRDITARKIRELAREKIINLPEARRRLENLGYSQADVNLLIAEMSRDFLMDLAKAEAAQAKTVAQQQKAAQAMLRANQAEKKRIQAELAQYASPSNLVDFYARSYIDEPILTNRLAAIIEDPAKVSWWKQKAFDERAKRVTI